jgi:hypothetical protein
MVLARHSYSLKPSGRSPSASALGVMSTISRRFDSKDNGIITKGDDGYDVRYNDLTAPMVKAMQEQQTISEERASND